MKRLINLFTATVFTVFLTSCGAGEEPGVETGNSSYEFKFLTGPLAGREYKASNLSREEVISIYTEEPGSNLKGIFTQMSNGDFLVTSTLALNAANQVTAFKRPDSEMGTQVFLSFSENGTNYAFSSASGSPVMKNLKIATIGSDGTAFLGLTTFELTFDNAGFYDEVGGGEGESEAVRISGKFVIR